METQSYAETTEENMFGIPAGFSPRFVSYMTALDNYEPVPRVIEHGLLVEYDDPGEISGQPRYMRANERSSIARGSVFLLDDGKTVRPYYGGGFHLGTASPLYPEGCEPHEILYPFPCNPHGATRPDRVLPDREQVIDYSGLLIGPRKAYLLKIRRGNG